MEPVPSNVTQHAARERGRFRPGPTVGAASLLVFLVTAAVLSATVDYESGGRYSTSGYYDQTSTYTSGGSVSGSSSGGSHGASADSYDGMDEGGSYSGDESGGTSTTTWGASGQLSPSYVSASNERRPANLRCTGEHVTYDAWKLSDGDPSTGWGASATDGTGESVRVEFSGSVRLTRVGLTPGYTKVGPRQDQGCASVSAFGFNRFVAAVRYDFDDGSSVTQNFDDQPTMQTLDVDTVTSAVTITILGTVRPPGADDDTVISEALFEGAA